MLWLANFVWASFWVKLLRATFFTLSLCCVDYMGKKEKGDSILLYYIKVKIIVCWLVMESWTYAPPAEPLHQTKHYWLMWIYMMCLCVKSQCNWIMKAFCWVQCRCRMEECEWIRLLVVFKSAWSMPLLSSTKSTGNQTLMRRRTICRCCRWRQLAELNLGLWKFRASTSILLVIYIEK